MAGDLDDVYGLILRAQVLEFSEPQRAHGMYETAERDLDTLLANEGGCRETLKKNFGLNLKYGSYFQSIQEGYNRLPKK
jgi:hypothetical protein